MKDTSVLGTVFLLFVLLGCERKASSNERVNEPEEIDYGSLVNELGVEAVVYARHEGAGELLIQRSEGIASTVAFFSKSLLRNDHTVFFNLEGENRVGVEPEGLLMYGSNLRFLGDVRHKASTYTRPVIDGKFVMDVDGQPLTIEVVRLQDAVEEVTFTVNPGDLTF